MRNHQLRDGDWPQVTKAIEQLRERNAVIYDQPAPTLTDIRLKARKWKHRRGIRVLYVDYLQKVRGASAQDFRLQIGEIAAGLKDLARELSICVVVLAQVKREVDNRSLGADGLGRMPFASDLAESGIIEQEADQILTLYRPQVYEPDKFDGLAYVSICKNRHGDVGAVSMTWIGEHLRFENKVVGF